MSEGEKPNALKSAKRKTNLPDLFQEVWQIYYAENDEKKENTKDSNDS